MGVLTGRVERCCPRRRRIVPNCRAGFQSIRDKPIVAQIFPRNVCRIFNRAIGTKLISEQPIKASILGRVGKQVRG